MQSSIKEVIVDSGSVLCPAFILVSAYQLNIITVTLLTPIFGGRKPIIPYGFIKEQENFFP
jgi:hypothetical protein